MSIDEETLVAPKIVKKLPKVVQTKQGETTTLEVKAIGKPQPTPKWLKANEEIVPSDDYLIENYPDGTSVLTIVNVQPEIIDQITFEAVSPIGIAKTATKLHIEGILSRNNGMDENNFKISTLGNDFPKLYKINLLFCSSSEYIRNNILFPKPSYSIYPKKKKNQTHSLSTQNFTLNTKTLFDIQLIFYFV